MPLTATIGTSDDPPQRSNNIPVRCRPSRPAIADKTAATISS